MKDKPKSDWRTLWDKAIKSGYKAFKHGAVVNRIKNVVFVKFK